MRNRVNGRKRKRKRKKRKKEKRKKRKKREYHKKMLAKGGTRTRIISVDRILMKPKPVLYRYVFYKDFIREERTATFVRFH